MCFIRGGDDDEIDVCVFDQRLRRRVDDRIGKRAGDIVAPATRDARQLQARLDCDQGRMKSGAGGTVANQAGTDRCHRYGPLATMFSLSPMQRIPLCNGAILAFEAELADRRRAQHQVRAQACIVGHPAARQYAQDVRMGK